jgi:prepilin-type N-terminal cleavage/methylation domain-containing protein
MTTTKHSINPTRDERGFSLIEVLVAIVILTVGLLSLAQMMVFSTNANTLSGRMTSCSALAKEQLERLKAAPFYSPGPPARNAPLAAGGDVNATVGGYSQLYDPDGLPTNDGTGLFETRWQITDVVVANLPLEMVRIQMRCLAASGNADQFAVIGEARFTTFRTANVR